MAKSILLHIGANKTGSTAIQDFLQTNVEPLRRCGIVVGSADLSAKGRLTGRHGPLFKALLADVEDGRRRIDNRIGLLMRELKDGERLVISAENLALSSHDPGRGAGELNGAEQLFASVARRYDIRVLLYIRRQDEFLLSSWQQWESKISCDFWARMIAAAGREGDWRAVLSAWEGVVPRENIAVRRYERARFPRGDIVLDFLEALGVSERGADFARPERDSNPGHAQALTEFAQGNPLLFRDMHDSQSYRTADALTGAQYRRKPRESLLSLRQRSAILERYEDSNEWVRETYFPDAPAPLFAPPAAQDYDEPPHEADEERWRLLASLIYGLAKRAQASGKPKA